MEDDCLKFMGKWLEKEPKLTPHPIPDIAPRMASLGGVKAVLFDIYGTLLVSASGDIEESEFSSDIMLRAFAETGVSSRKDVGYDYLLDAYRKEIELYHGRNSAPEVYPEIDVVEMWRKVLLAHACEGTYGIPAAMDYRKFAFVFEMLSNPVYPMPKMGEVVAYLRGRGYVMGIVSNAQFYTPAIMNYFISGGKHCSEERVDCFAEDISFFSYRFGRSKPDRTIFSAAAESLRGNHGICPAETLFVGNDMFKDVYPADRAGFKTALFAGDIKSLRMRREKKEIGTLEPYMILTELEQLKELL